MYCNEALAFGLLLVLFLLLLFRAVLLRDGDRQGAKRKVVYGREKLELL